jgi:hypothetical protein
MVDRSGIVQKLEDRAEAVLRDRHLLAQVPGGNGAGQSAVAEYTQLSQDSNFLLGI